MSTFPVAILAGGLATRLRPITEKIPKAMVELNGEPFIAHQLRLLKSRGLDRVVICAWYRGELIREYVHDGAPFGLRVDYSFDGELPLGTGGAIQRALPLLGPTFFVLYGDSYLPCDYQAVQAGFTHSGCLGLMTVFRNQGRWDTSNVEYSAGQIRRYEKKMSTPAMQYIDYGLGLFQAQAFAGFPGDSAFDLAAVYQALLEQKQLAGYEVAERFYEIGSFEGLEELRGLLRDQKSHPGESE